MRLVALVKPSTWLGGLGSLLAVILSVMARRQIRRANGEQTGEGLALAGLIIGIVGLIGAVLLTMALVSVGNAVHDATTATRAPVAPEDSPLPMGQNVPRFPTGTPGQVAIIMQGRPVSVGGGVSVPLVVRNNTAKPVHRVQATASERDASGTLIGSGEDQGFYPNLVQPGEISFGYVYLKGPESLPPNTTINVQLQSKRGEETGFYARQDLSVTEANLVDKHLVGAAHNTASRNAVSGPLAVRVLCFSGDQATDVRLGYAQPDTVAPGATATFSVDLFDTPCSGFLVAAGGFDK